MGSFNPIVDYPIGTTLPPTGSYLVFDGAGPAKGFNCGTVPDGLQSDEVLAGPSGLFTAGECKSFMGQPALDREHILTNCLNIVCKCNAH